MQSRFHNLHKICNRVSTSWPLSGALWSLGPVWSLASHYDVNDQWLSPRRSHKKLTPAELQWLPSTICLCLGILLQSADVQGQCTEVMAQMRAVMQGRASGWISQLWWITSFARFLQRSNSASTPRHQIRVQCLLRSLKPAGPGPTPGSGSGALQLQLWSRPSEETGTQKSHSILLICVVDE